MSRNTLLIGGPLDGIRMSVAEGCDFLTLEEKPIDSWWLGFPESHARSVIGCFVPHEYRTMLVTPTTKVMVHDSIKPGDAYERIISFYPVRTSI